jgi:hypothetical protein
MKLSAQSKPPLITLFCVAGILFLPLAGYLAAGKPLAPILAFPPQTMQQEYPPFSWPVFIGMTLFVLTVCLPFAWQFFVSATAATKSSPKIDNKEKFPYWGWSGLCLLIGSWILAWNRFEWFARLQPYTFFPLWLGYIITVNGLTYRNQGTCLLLRDPAGFYSLFASSSLFWWGFEYLNRFVRNWHYLGVEDFSAAGYFLHATVCFSTVLPAVLATQEFLLSYSIFHLAWRNLWRPSHIYRHSPLPAWCVLFLAVFCLGGFGFRPDQLYLMLWLTPLMLLTALQALMGEQTIFFELRTGDWRQIWSSALAALICGFFWEMWNFKSYAHWVYTVPYVERYHLFAMPLIGYAGYLPFGVICLAVAKFFLRVRSTTCKPPLPSFSWARNSG